MQICRARKVMGLFIALKDRQFSLIEICDEHLLELLLSRCVANIHFLEHFAPNAIGI